jgi:hypothetical protein
MSYRSRINKKSKNQNSSQVNILQEDFTLNEINNLNDFNEFDDLNYEDINKNSRTYLFQKIRNIFINLIFFVIKTARIIFKLYGIYFLWICLHYFSAHLYVKFCVPNSIVGFFMSPFMIITPHCQGLRWIVYNAAHIINNMWILIGAWIYSIIWIINDPIGKNE